MQLFAKFKKIMWSELRATLNFRKIGVTELGFELLALKAKGVFSRSCCQGN